MDEWKQKTADYKAASIPLGRFEFTNTQGVVDSPFAKSSGGQLQDQQSRALAQQQYQPQQQQQQQPYENQQRRNDDYSTPSGLPSSSTGPRRPSEDEEERTEGFTLLPPGTFTSASVVSFHQESDQYWFRIHAVFLPDSPTDPTMRLTIFRLYDDFYHFQISLLDAFPAEAGRALDGGPESPGATDDSRRILPYMPGPLDFIDDAITNTRREDLDVYIKFLIGLHRRDAGYILSHELVRRFFSLGTGDTKVNFSRAEAEQQLADEQDADPLEDPLAALSLNDHGDDDETGRYESSARSNNSGRRSYYANGGGGGPDTTPVQREVPHEDRGPYSAGSSNQSLPRIDTTLRGPPSTSANPSTLNSNTSSRPGSDYASGLATSTTSSSWGSNAAGGILSSSHGNTMSPLTSSQPQAPPSRSTSAQNNTGGGGGSSAYKKIKIFDRATDDLIAIRVPPNVSFEGLMEKVQDRLGGGRRMLRYRDSHGGGGFRNVGNDEDLEEWMEVEEKLVL